MVIDTKQNQGVILAILQPRRIQYLIRPYPLLKILQHLNLINKIEIEVAFYDLNNNFFQKFRISHFNKDAKLVPIWKVLLSCTHLNIEEILKIQHPLKINKLLFNFFKLL